MNRRPRLLVLRALGLGDLLTAVPALRALRRRFEGHHLELAAPAVLAPLVAEVVDEVVDTAGLSRPLAASRHLPAMAVNLPGRGPESSRLLAATAPGRLCAFAHPAVPATAGGPVWADDEHEVRRWCRLVGRLGASADPTDLELAPPAGRPRRGLVSGAVVVHPGAGAPSRRWPGERFAALVRWLVEDGHHVLVTGSAAERSLAERVSLGADGARGRGSVAVLAGRTSVVELATLVARARLVIAGDTGVAHLATAYATPSVLLFGPTPPAAWGPLTGGPHRVLWAGGVGDPHAVTADAGLLALGPHEVRQAVEDQLALVPPAGAVR